jgi:hypothetical protein
MTKKEMLEKMGFSNKDFQDYVAKSTQFVESLNKKQRRFHLNSKHPPVSLEVAAKAFGADVTAKQLMDLFGEAPIVDGVLTGSNTCCGPYRGPKP